MPGRGVARAVATCEALGRIVTDSAFTYDPALLGRVLITITAVETAHAIDQRLADIGRSLAEDGIEPFTRLLYEHGRTVTGTDVAATLRGTERIGREVAPLFSEHDVLLTPTMAVPPPPLGWVDTTRPETMATMGPLTAFTAVFNLTGQPAMSALRFGLGRRAGRCAFVARWGRSRCSSSSPATWNAPPRGRKADLPGRRRSCTAPLTRARTRQAQRCLLV